VILRKALELAMRAHLGQKRKYTNEPYIVHPMRVSLCMGGWGESVMAAAVLHDVLEDCPKVREFHIVDACGEDVLEAVKDLTNPSKGLDLPRAERKALDREHYRGKSVAVCTIKAWDRIDNLRDMGDAPDDFRRLYAAESSQLLDVLREQNLGMQLAQRLDEAIEAIEG
jgi:(p)ppGpp synthase/HD superfamily hydrolase